MSSRNRRPLETFYINFTIVSVIHSFTPTFCFFDLMWFMLTRQQCVVRRVGGAGMCSGDHEDVMDWLWVLNWSLVRHETEEQGVLEQKRGNYLQQLCSIFSCSHTPSTEGVEFTPWPFFLQDLCRALLYVADLLGLKVEWVILGMMWGCITLLRNVIGVSCSVFNCSNESNKPRGEFVARQVMSKRVRAHRGRTLMSTHRLVEWDSRNIWGEVSKQNGAKTWHEP